MQARIGYPGDPTSFVDNVIPLLQLTQERYLLRDIHLVSVDIDSTIQWLARPWSPCKLSAVLQRTDGVHLEEEEQRWNGMLAPMYWWAEVDCKQTVVLQQVGVASEAIVNWFNFYCNIACMYCIDHPVQIGGPGTMVGIDESKFIHCKYHRGQYREGHWVLGLVERRTNYFVLIPVPDHSAQTLVSIIDVHCLPGTHIITDGWCAYNGLLNPPVINHNVNFVDPNDATIHTNTIEDNWGNVKTKYRNMHGTLDALWDTYLHEFCCRSIFHDNFFMNFLFWVRRYYPL